MNNKKETTNEKDNADLYIEQLKSRKRKREKSSNFELDYWKHLEKEDNDKFMAFLESEQLSRIMKEIQMKQKDY